MAQSPKARYVNGSGRSSTSLVRKYNLNDELTQRLIRLNQKTAVNFVDYESIVAASSSSSSGGKPRFDFAGSDVMVFLHIQKTGGSSFERHLVQDISLDKPCQAMGEFGNPRKDRKKKRKKLQKKLYSCLRPGSQKSSWLFSRFSTGWKCGLHADWTELTECVDSYLDASEGVDNRRYFYMTFLREPVARYVSEFLHVQRGATWRDTQYMCGGVSGLPQLGAPCYPGEDWEGVTLAQFNGCPSNMAFNRQTRMLADLRLVHCYNSTAMAPGDRDRAMLASAKANLRNMAFFGMTARQAESQLLFEETFKLRFKVDFETEDQQSEGYDLSPEETQRIRDLNSLDVELYSFALDLLQERYKAAVQSATNLSKTMNNIEA